MVGTVLANVGLTGQIPDGADGWGSAMNLNTLLVDSLISQKAISNTITTPPVSPALGDVYIVPTGATGAWSAAVDKLAVWNSTAWVFITPKNGWRFYVVSSGDYYRYSGSAWVLNTSQPLNANLTAYAGLTLAADKGVYATGAGALSTYTLTSYARTLLSSTSDAQARFNLGLGTASQVNTGTSGGTVPLQNGSNTWSGTQTISNASLIIQVNNDTATTAPQLSLFKSRVGPLAPLSGATLGSYYIGGYDSASYLNTIQIGGYATENWDSTHAGCEIRFANVIAGNAANTRSPRWVMDGSFRPYADNAVTVGTSAFRPSTIYAVNGTINTSDEREKTSIRKLTEVELACALELASDHRIWQWIHSVEKEGVEVARLHCSPTVQQVMKTMESFGLEPFRYSFVCYDIWNAKYEPIIIERDIVDDFGNQIHIEDDTGEKRCIREAGDRFSLRPNEFLNFICAGLAANQRKIQSDQRVMQEEINDMKLMIESLKTN